MKKFSKIVYFLILALFVLSMSGCGGGGGGPLSGSSDSNSNSNGNTNTNNNTNTNTNSGTDYTPVDTTNATASVTTENGVTKIVLSTGTTASNAAFSTAADALTVEDYVWHVSPDVAGEYWTYGDTSFDSESAVQALVTSQDGIYIARDIRYVPNTLTFSSTTVTKANGNAEGDNDKLYPAYYSTGVNADGDEYDSYDYILAALPADNTTLETVKASMTHSPSDAYNYPVLHITKPGTYEISGEWQGQIWIDAGKKKDETALVTLILNGLTVSCDVAPALVFYNVYQGSEYLTSTDVQGHSMDVAASLSDDTEVKAGAVVLLADGSVNNFYGTNVARLNNALLDSDYTTSALGKYVKAQDKMYKLDGAFHSRRSMFIGLDDGAASGTLNINANYEGLNSELHMLIADGTINVTAGDDGINVNEDDTSVFHMSGGSLTISAPNGDGIDSNGYIIFTGADKLSITAAQDSDQLNAGAEGPLDANLGVYMASEVQAIYEHSGSGNQPGGGTQPGGEPPSGEQPGGEPPSGEQPGGEPPSGFHGGPQF